MRLVDVVLSLPYLLPDPADRVVLRDPATSGSSSSRSAITGWTTAARLVRAEFLHLREMDFVAGGEGPRRLRTAGSSPATCCRARWPRSSSPATLGVADSIVGEAALSFLGFGIAPPEASLGTCSTATRTTSTAHPQRIFYPGLVLVVIVLCASFLGDGLRDALDPRQRVESRPDRTCRRRPPDTERREPPRDPRPQDALLHPGRRRSGRRRRLASRSSTARRSAWSASPAAARASPRCRSCA